MSLEANAHLDETLVQLLQRVPPRWTELAGDALSAVEEQALRLLIAAGLVERKFSIRMTLIGHPVRLEITATMTGEHGLAAAMEPVLHQAWRLWADAYREQRGQHDKEERPHFFCEQTAPAMWRMTAQTPLALDDVAQGQRQRLLDFVHRRSPVFMGKVVPGYGHAERIHETRNDSSPTQVEVTNLDQLTGPMAAMMEKMFEKMAALEQKLATVPAAPVPSTISNMSDASGSAASRGTRGPARMSVHEAWRYVTTLQAWTLIQQQNNGKPQRQRKRKSTFAREQGIAAAELDAMLAWYRKYHTKGLFPKDPNKLIRDQLDKLFA